jgi:hypothetical protein
VSRSNSDAPSGLVPVNVDLRARRLLIATMAGLTLTRFGWAIVRVGREIS